MSDNTFFTDPNAIPDSEPVLRDGPHNCVISAVKIMEPKEVGQSKNLMVMFQSEEDDEQGLAAPAYFDRSDPSQMWKLKKLCDLLELNPTAVGQNIELLKGKKVRIVTKLYKKKSDGSLRAAVNDFMEYED